MTTDEILETVELEMDESLEILRKELGRIRTGRAHPGMLDHVNVDYYGTPTALRSLASVSVQDGRSIVITPYDKSSAKVIEQALVAMSGLSVPVQSDGAVLRMNLPDLTTDTRKDLVREMKKKGEEAKVRVRSARRDGNEEAKKAEKAKKMTEDDLKRLLEAIQKLTDKYCADVDEAMDHKEKDIMEI